MNYKPHLPKGVLFSLCYLIIGLLYGLLLISWHNTTGQEYMDAMLVFLIIPVIYSALYYSRWLYIINIIILTVISIWVLTHIMDNLAPSLRTLSVVVFIVAVSSELLFLVKSSRNKAELALLESQTNLQNVFDTVDDFLLIIDADGSILHSNPAVHKRLGYSAEELEYMNFYDIQLSDHLDKFLEKTSTFYTMSFKTKDGSSIPVETRFTLGVWNNQNVLFGISRDVSERKRAEEALRISEMRLRQVMDLVPHMIFAKDIEGRYLLVNYAMAEAYGMQVEALTGELEAKIHQDSKEAELSSKEDREVITSNQTKFIPKRLFIDATGDEHYLQITKVPFTIANTEKPAVLGIAVDITELTIAEGKLKQYRDHLEELVKNRTEELLKTNQDLSNEIKERKLIEEKLTKALKDAEAASIAKSQFLAKMSHELRTPLNSIIGFSNILLKNKSQNLTDQDINFLKRIEENGKHLLELINDVLDLSKVEAGRMELHMEEINLPDLIQEITGQLEDQIRNKPLEFRIEIPDACNPAVLDRAKLKQVLINLVGNAIKFTPEGHITLRISTDHENAPTTIEVIDTGIGIPEEKLKSIFEAFQQADSSTTRKFGGSGLGLAISQSLCHLMKCHIKVSSTVNQGSTFTIHLAQLASSKETAHPVEIKPIPTPSDTDETSPPLWIKEDTVLSDKVVLVIDDESDSRLLLKDFIEELGCTVITADSGEQGLRLTHKFHPDLITLDLMMPNLNGWEVLKHLKDDPELSSIPILIISIIANENQGTLFGNMDSLNKPIERDELLATIRRNLIPSRGRILVVEDNKYTQEVVAIYLEREGFDVLTASNGQEALDCLPSFHPNLILLDLLMPVMDGLQFMQILRDDARFKSTPVIIMTAKSLTPEEFIQLEETTLAIIKKSDSFEHNLKQTLQEILKSGKFTDLITHN